MGTLEAFVYNHNPSGIIEIAWLEDYRKHKLYSGYSLKDAIKLFKTEMKQENPRIKIEIYIQD